MEDIEFCGNIPKKFPGGPQQGELTRATLASLTLLPALTRVARLDPEPEPWKAPGGSAGGIAY